MLKRSFDYLGAGIGLICCAPFFALISLAIKLTSPGPALFRQDRVGLDGKIFRIYKFRTMHADSHLSGASVTAGDDDRITPLGAFLRRHKLDELPQLINVISGDMSLVGPRPEVKEFVDLFPEEYASILTVRPGITHLGTLMFRNEEDILAGAVDPRARYLRFVMPLKLKVYLDRLEQTLSEDLQIILATVFPGLWFMPFPAVQLDGPAVAKLIDYVQLEAPAVVRSGKAMEEMA